MKFLVKGLFGSVVDVIFQSVFCLKIHQNDKKTQTKKLI
jgi:hypothetical protein